MQGISQSQNHIVEHNLILVYAADHIHHDIALALIQHDPVVVENDIRGLLCCLLHQAFLECFLRFHVWVGGLCCWCICPFSVRIADCEWGKGEEVGDVLECVCAGPEVWCGAL
jgi:hypothetical protein